MITWHRAPEWPPDAALDPAGWALEPVKLAPHRDVFRARLPGLDVHMKHYRPDGRERLRVWVRDLKGHAEFERGRELLRRGVPTLLPLAWGADGLHSYVVTRTLPGAVTLLEHLTAGWDARIPNSLGRFLALCHEAGVRHDDLHPGNVLFDAEGRLYLIDLHMARLGPPLSAAESAANLAVMDRWFGLRYSRTVRLRGFRAYDAARPAIDVRALAEESRRSLGVLVRDLDRRCRGKGRHFVRIPGGLAAAGVDPAALRALMAQADERLDDPAARVMKRSASSTVIEVPVLHEGAAREMVLKRFDATRWSDAVAEWFRPGPALRSWRMGHALTVRGLPSPRCLAVWHRGATGYLLQEMVPEARYLKAFLADASPAQRREMAHQLGRLVRRLHGWEVTHRDLKAPNLLVSPARPVMGVRGLEAPAADGGAHLWLVDLVGAAVVSGLGEGRMMRDVARLNASFLDDPTVSRTDRLRVLASYLNAALAGMGGWKRWWRAVAALSEAKRRRNERVGRVLG